MKKVPVINFTKKVTFSMAVNMTTLKSLFKMLLYGYVVGQSKIQIIRLRCDSYFKLATWLAHWP